MRVVKRAQVDAQFPLPTGTADSVNVEELVRKLLLITTLLGEKHEKVRRGEHTNTYLRSKGGVEGMVTP